MKFVKKPLSPIERLRYFIRAFDWLPLVHIPCYDHDTKKWRHRYFPFRDRVDCFLIGVDTAICGYVYGVD